MVIYDPFLYRDYWMIRLLIGLMTETTVLSCFSKITTLQGSISPIFSTARVASP